MHILRLIAILLLLNGCSSPAMAYNEEEAIKAVIGEAEGNSDEMLAVSEAIRHRGTLKGVYGLKSFRVRYHLYSEETYDEAETAWEESRYTNITHGATGWGNASDMRKFSRLKWFKHCSITAHIGRQWFYKVRS